MKIFILVFALLASPSVMAYIDPGSGMLLIQGFIALLAAIIAFMKSPLKTIKDLWRRIRKGRDA